MCSRAQLYLIVDYVYYRVCEEEEGDERTCKKLMRIVNELKTAGFEEVKNQIGV